MPIKGFLKTNNMPDTYTEITQLTFNLHARYITITLMVWKDDTKAVYLHTTTYDVNSGDPFWTTYFETFVPKNDLTDAVDDYLLARSEFEDCTKEP